LPRDVGAGADEFAALAAAGALVLDDDGGIVIANPFSGVETDFVVESGGRSWFANCAWDGLGILAALGRDGSLRTTCVDCGDAIEVRVEGERVHGEAVAHFLLPAGRWYDDLAYT
jgi:hypothetical protein